MKKLALYGTGLLAAFIVGWFLHPKASGDVISSGSKLALNPSQTVAVRLLADLLGRLQRHDAAVTAESQRVLSLSKVYRDSLDKLRPRQNRDTVWIREATTPRDSAQRCSVVLLDCERRADLAEARASVLQAQLGKQVTLQPHRVAVTLGVGPTFVLLPKRAAGLGANVSLSLRLW